VRTVAIIQARMNSTRLPGKVLRPLLGRPMLERMIERLSRCKVLNDIVIATSTSPADDVIAAFAEERGYRWMRGSEQDVLGRYVEAARQFQADIVVRLTGDCPLIDPEVCARVIRKHQNTRTNDLTSNIVKRTYPRGLDTEVLSFRCLERLEQVAKEGIYREHVTNYLYDHPDEFVIEGVSGNEDHSDVRLCVDTQEDWELVEALYQSLYSRNSRFGIEDILNVLHERPELRRINESVEQAKIFQHRKEP